MFSQRMQEAAASIGLRGLAPWLPIGQPGRKATEQILSAMDGGLFFARGSRRAKAPSRRAAPADGVTPEHG